MRNSIWATLFLLGANTTLLAQKQPATTDFFVTTKTYFFNSDSIKQGSERPIDNMVIYYSSSNTLYYQYNNGQGQNVYKAALDNMPVLKPDSTVLFNMPVKPVTATPVPVIIVPQVTPLIQRKNKFGLQFKATPAIPR